MEIVYENVYNENLKIKQDIKVERI